MSVSRETYCHSPQELPQPYAPTSDGFERRLRAWVRLSADDVTTPDAADASAPPKEHGAWDHT